MDYKTQRARILAHLQEGKSITALQALNLFDCMRLAVHINIYRNKGYNIHTEMVYNKETKKQYAKYTLIK